MRRIFSGFLKYLSRKTGALKQEKVQANSRWPVREFEMK